VALSESSSAVGLRRHCVPFVRRSESQTVMWLSGEHDLSTVDPLSEMLARAFALDDADVVLDLSGVQFMGGARSRSSPGPRTSWTFGRGP
jgi:hypothetical protein